MTQPENQKSPFARRLSVALEFLFVLAIWLTGYSIGYKAGHAQAQFAILEKFGSFEAIAAPEKGAETW